MKYSKIFFVICLIILSCALGFQIADNNLHMLQSPGAVVPDYKDQDYGLGSSYVDSLKPYPDFVKGDRTPFNLWEYAGKGKL